MGRLFGFFVLNHDSLFRSGKMATLGKQKLS